MFDVLSVVPPIESREFPDLAQVYCPLPGRGPPTCREAASQMSTRIEFLYRIDMWSRDGKKVIEHLAGVEDLRLAMATYRAACECWPGMPITLSQGARVIESPVRIREDA